MSKEDLTAEEVESVANAMSQAPSDDKKEQAASPQQGEGSDQPAISRAQFMQLETTISQELAVTPDDLKRMYDIKVNVEVILGTTKMPLNDILKLHPGSVVELNRLAGEPVDIMANNRLIARAEIVVIEDNFGVKILEIVTSPSKLAAVNA